MAIHNRFKHPEAWATYKRHIREGRIFHPIGKNFPRFRAETLLKMGKGVPYEEGTMRQHTFLDDLR